MLSALFDTYVEPQHRHHGIRLTRVLVVLIVATFAFSAVSFAYAAGRQSDAPASGSAATAPQL